MSDFPDDLKYAKSHEWVKIEEDGTALVGITDHAQAQMGDLVFVELPEIGQELSIGDECAVVESVKAASDVYSPLTGEVEDVNDTLDKTPGFVNNDPYGSGWLFRVRIDDESQLDDLLDAEAYAEVVEQEG